MNIRQITINDNKALQSIAKQTFRETFAAGNTKENMDKYLEEKFSLDSITSEIENPESIFYVVEIDNKMIGYLKLNFGRSQTELKENSAVEIERIYVFNEYHGQKIGQLLFEKALEIARDRKAEYIWLGVWDQNPRAIRFYEKNGFTPFDKHVFTLGDDRQTDIMMKMELAYLQ